MCMILPLLIITPIGLVLEFFIRALKVISFLFFGYYLNFFLIDLVIYFCFCIDFLYFSDLGVIYYDLLVW